MNRLRFLAVVTIISVCSPAFARDVAPVHPETMLDDIEWLAGPEFDGRLSGSSGNAAAARALAERLDELGGEPLPGAGSLLHAYEQPVVQIIDPPRLSLAAPGTPTAEFEAGIDFDILVREGTRISGPLTARVVELTAENATREWIAGHQESALVISPELFGELTRDNRLMRALFHPTESPAAVIIGMPAGMGAMPRSLFLTTDDYASVGPATGPMLIQMTHDAIDRLRAFVTAPERQESAGSPTIAVHGGYAVETATVTNVAAVLPARGPRTPDTPILITAHLDGPGRLADSWHYPGAIDNASGVAVVLEVAGTLAEGGSDRSRPVWVVFFNGEEQGMRGSKAFVSAYREYLPGTRVVNVDMAGLSGVPVSVTRTADATELAARAAKRLAERELEATVNEGGGSDHLSFAGVAPAISLVQSPYRRMHRPTDSPENVDGRTLEAIARALLDLVTDTGRRSAGESPADRFD